MDLYLCADCNYKFITEPRKYMKPCITDRYLWAFGTWLPIITRTLFVSPYYNMAIEYLYVYDEIFPREILIINFTIQISLRLFRQFSIHPIRHFLQRLLWRLACRPWRTNLIRNWVSCFIHVIFFSQPIRISSRRVIRSRAACSALIRRLSPRAATSLIFLLLGTEARLHER